VKIKPVKSKMIDVENKNNPGTKITMAVHT